MGHSDSGEQAQRNDSGSGDVSAWFDEEPATLGWQLRKLAGVAPNASRFAIHREECDIDVEISSHSWVVLSIRMPEAVTRSKVNAVYRSLHHQRRIVRARRPMHMGLAPETTRDQARKEAGINREVTVGDAQFDAGVYIHTLAPDDTVRSVLSDAALRAAIVDMIREEPRNLTLDDQLRGGLTVEFGGPEPYRPGSAARIVACLSAIYAHLPALEATGTQPGRWTLLQAIGSVVLVCLPGGVLCSWQMLEASAAGTRAALLWWRAVAIGVAAGGVLAVPLCLVIFYRVRGEFHSATKQRLMMIASTIVLMQFATLIAHWFRY